MVKSDTFASPMMLQTAPSLESVKVDLAGRSRQHLRCELSGVGEAKAKAKAIVVYRESNGPFASVGELLEVKGIGTVILGYNRDKHGVN